MFKGKKILITGHTGFKGSWLSQWLMNLGAEVVGFAQAPYSDPNHYEVLGLNKSMKSIMGDIRDRDLVRKIIHENKPDVIFHMAAEALVRKCYDTPALAFETNAMGTLNVLEALRDQDFVQASVFITSDKCYENVEWEQGYKETDRLGGKDPYSASKAAAEVIFHAYYESYFRNSSTAMATTRAGNVIGGGDWASDRIVPDAVRAWSKSQALTLRSPEATRPWQHVLEPLSGYLTVAEGLLKNTHGVSGEAFNFGPPEESTFTVKDLIDEMAHGWRSAEVQVDASQSGAKKEATLLKLSCEKAWNLLKWKPTLTHSETVSLTSQWYRDFYESEKVTTLEQIQTYEKLGKERGLIWAN